MGLCDRATRVQLRAILRKDALLARRNKRDTFRELGLPFILLAVMIALSKALGAIQVDAVPRPTTRQVPTLAGAASGMAVWVAPCAAPGALGAFAADVAAAMAAASPGLNVSCRDCETPAGCGAASVVGGWLAGYTTVLGAVVFDAPLNASAGSPATYRIRLDSASAPGAGGTNSTACYGADGEPAAPDGTPGGYVPYVLPLQAAVDAAIGVVATTAAGVAPPAPFTLAAVSFPQPAYSINVGGMALSAIVPLYMTLIFSLLVRGGLTRILAEKEAKIAISMRIAGLARATNVAAWTVSLALRQTVVVTVVVTLAVVGGVFPRSSFSLVWVFFTLMQLTVISFTFAASALFSKARTGGVVGMLLYILLSAPSYALTLGGGGAPGWVRVGLGVFAPCGFSLGLQAIVQAEQKGVGMGWTNAGDPGVSTAGVSLLSLMGVLAVDVVLYTLLAVYLDAVVPTEFGVPRHPLFCCGAVRKGRPGSGRGGDEAGLAEVAAARATMARPASGDDAAPGRVSRLLASLFGGYAPVSSPGSTTHAIGPTRWAASDSRGRGGSADHSASTALVGAGNDAEDHAIAARTQPLHSDAVDIAGESSAAAIARRLVSGAGSGGDVEPVAAEVIARGGVEVTGLSKVFYGQEGARLALDGLQVGMYAGQCTAILGHNGAGKSTLQKILTGMYAPTAGRVTVFGSEAGGAGTGGDGGVPAIGYCPQHDDALFDQLSVEEHLQLFGALKGLDGAPLDAAIDELVGVLGLGEKRHAAAGTLSGGQKRRLSLALALIGRPRVLVLDEPTAGVDAAARRHVWSALAQCKAGGRTAILLATHHCDEASLLGDRVLLLARGRLRVAGSPLFLKSRFGLGYHLEVVVSAVPAPPRSGAVSGAVSGADAAVAVADAEIARDWAAAVRARLPGAHLRSARRTNATATAAGGGATGGTAALKGSLQLPPSSAASLELAFVLPQQAGGAGAGGFAALFSELEGLEAATRRGDVKPAMAAAPPDGVAWPDPYTSYLRSFSVSVTTLEEVFLRITALLEAEEAAEADARFFAAAAAAGAYVSPPAAPQSVSLLSVQPSSSAGESSKAVLEDGVGDGWWLDVRRRWAYAGGGGKGVGVRDVSLATAAAEGAAYVAMLAAAGVVLPRPRALPPARGTAAHFAREVCLQTRRRRTQALRDRRGVLLQSVLPLVFVAVSAVFRLLSPIGGLPTAATAVFDPATFAGPLAAPGAPARFTLPWGVLPATGGGPADPAFVAAINATVAGMPAPPSAPIAPAPGAFPGGAQPASVTDALAAVGGAGGGWAAGAVLAAPPTAAGAPYALTLLWNYTLTQGLPATLGAWDAGALGAALGRPSGAPSLLHATMDPLPPSAGDVSGGGALGAFLAPALMGLYATLGFLTIPSVLAGNMAKERATRCKQLQLISGATPAGYWAAAWLWDVAMYVPTWVGACALVYAVGPPQLSSPAGFPAAAALLAAFGVTAPLLAYTASFAFTKQADAQMATRLTCTVVLIALFAVSLPLTLPGVGDVNPALTAAAGVLDYASLVFPPYALVRGFAVIGVQGVCPPAVVAAGGTCVLPPPLSWGVAGRHVALALLSAPLWLAVIAVMERRAVPQRAAVGESGLGGAAAAALPDAPGYGSLASGGGGGSAAQGVGEDADVRDERALLRRRPRWSAADAAETGSGRGGGGGAPADDSSVALLGLRKVYPPSASARAATAAAANGDGDGDALGGGKVAVADLWLSVPPGQILGLLGANGAGKTTTLSMLVGEAAATAGSVSLCGHDPARPATRSMQLLGYCPQFDALFDTLSTREHVAYYAALNGTPAEHVPALVDAALATLDLRPHADTLAQHLSGGNRRRLSLVLAYIGAPRVVAIDEATTGVDPAARRRMFAAIQAAAPRRATVATTHLIEEAGALCGRIGIMVGGRLACLGSPSHLAATYGAGYSVEVSDAADEGASAGGSAPPPALAVALAAAAPGARLVDANGGVFRYEAAALSLGVAFAALEAARAAGVIRDFSVCQTSLEAVFLRFSRLQEEADEAEARAAAAAAGAAGGRGKASCGRG